MDRTSPSSQTTSASSTSSASPGRAPIGAPSSGPPARPPLLEVGRRPADDLPQAFDGRRGDLVLLVQGVQPARVDAPLVGGRCRCHLPILTGAAGARSLRSAVSPASWGTPLPDPPATGGGGSDRAARCG